MHIQSILTCLIGTENKWKESAWVGGGGSCLGMHVRIKDFKIKKNKKLKKKKKEKESAWQKLRTRRVIK